MNPFPSTYPCDCIAAAIPYVALDFFTYSSIPGFNASYISDTSCISAVPSVDVILSNDENAANTPVRTAIPGSILAANVPTAPLAPPVPAFLESSPN